MRCSAAVMRPKMLSHIDWKSDNIDNISSRYCAYFLILSLPRADRPIAVLNQSFRYLGVASFVISNFSRIRTEAAISSAVGVLHVSIFSGIGRT